MREMLIELEVDSTDRRWQERANCLGVDPDLFFPERGASTKEAKSVCGGCARNGLSVWKCSKDGTTFSGS